MTDDTEPTLAAEADVIDELQETDQPIETALSMAKELPEGAISIASGGLLLLTAIRSLARGKRRGILTAIAGAGLLRHGLRNRGDDDRSTFEPETDEIEGGSDGKETSDAAHAAAKRPDSGRESQIDAEGEIDDSAQLGEEGETGSRVEFTDDAEASEPRSKPDVDGDEADPRRKTDDENVEIDVSEPAMAEEVAEATGPDPEQAQPSQTDATEPESTSDEDASEMKVEPDDDENDGESTSGERDADDEDGT